MTTPTLMAGGSLTASFFDTVGGLPVHPLVVHVAVVLLPLSALGLIVLVIWRRRVATFGWLVLVGLFVGTGAAFVAKESGEQLARRVGLPADHAEWGNRLPWLALALFVVSLAWYWVAVTSRRGTVGVVLLSVLAVALAIATIALAIVVGHSGAEAAWSGVVN